MDTHTKNIAIQSEHGINGGESIAAMGVDTPLAVLSDKRRPLFDYFKQLFAQVTNPPIDAIREEIVTCTTVYAGKQGNLLEEKEEKLPGIKDQQSDPDKYRYVEDQKNEKRRIPGCSCSDYLL